MSEPLKKEGIDAAMNIIGRMTGDDETYELLSGTVDVFRDRIDEFTTALNPKFRISDYRLLSDLYRHIYLYGVVTGIALYDRAVLDDVDLVTWLTNKIDETENDEGSM